MQRIKRFCQLIIFEVCVELLLGEGDLKETIGIPCPQSGLDRRIAITGIEQNTAVVSMGSDETMHNHFRPIQGWRLFWGSSRGFHPRLNAVATSVAELQQKQPASPFRPSELTTTILSLVQSALRTPGDDRVRRSVPGLLDVKTSDEPLRDRSQRRSSGRDISLRGDRA